jgi:hypothetical protein
MTHNDIGSYAGMIWHLLLRKGQMSLREIGECTNLRDTSIYAALGWLMREDKINISFSPNSINIELDGVHSECYY